MPKRPKSGPAKYGYKRQGSIFVADEYEAPILLYIFELFAEHQRKQIVIGILNQEKHTTRIGAQFTSTTITRLLTDRSVIGVEGEYEAIIPKELWERCNAILEAQKTAGGAKRAVAHLFSGLVHCGCGQKMYVPSNGKKYVCGDCRNKIATDDLEHIFRLQLQTYTPPRDILPTGQNLYSVWSDLSFKNKRDVIEAITKRIEVADKEITCFLFSL